MQVLWRGFLILLVVVMLVGLVFVASKCSVLPTSPKPTATARVVEVTRVVKGDLEIRQVPVTQIVMQTQVVEKVVEATPRPTYTPLPTYTPYPTWTPLPTAVSAPKSVVTSTVVVVSGPGPASTVTVKVISTKTTATATDRFKPDWGTVDWYQSPVMATKYHPNPQTQETFGEPGVLLDATAAYDHMSQAETAILVPEGGYSYIAIGGGEFRHENAVLSLTPVVNNIYLIIFRGFPDDATEADLNQIVFAQNYVRGTGIYSPMPAGAYVSLGWFAQQVAGAYLSPNCGIGCRKTTIIVVDLETRTYRTWTNSNPKDPLDWEWNSP